ASTVGQAAGMHSSGLGKAILAWSDTEFIERYMEAGLERRTPKTIVTAAQLWSEIRAIKEVGYAIDDEENEAGVHCVSAPILNHDARVIASLSVSGTVQQIPHTAMPALSEMVKRYAHRVSTLMGYAAG